MVSRTLPNLGLTGFFDLGEDGWKDEMDLNLLLISCLAQGGVISTVSATPGSPTDGDVYLFDDTHPTQANKIAIRDNGAWVYVTPVEGWKVYDRTAELFRYFTGTEWAEFVASGGGSVPPGGTTGQVLTKLSGTDGDADWQDPTGGGGGGGGGGGLVLIDEFIAVGGETFVEFTGIPDTYKGLKILTHARGNAAAGDTAFQLQLNGDTGANYFYRQTFFPFGGAGADNQTSASTVQFGCANAPTNQFDGGVIEIPYYASSVGHKSWVFQSFNTEGSSQYRTIFGGGVWKSTTPVDSVKLLVGFGALVAGSRVALYGYGEGGGGGGGGGGGMTLLDEVTLSASASSIDFSAIPGTYKNLVITGQLRGLNSAAFLDCLLRFNGDTGFNYSYEKVNRFASDNAGGSTFVKLGAMPGNTAPTDSFNSFSATIVEYANDSRHKGVTGTSYAFGDTPIHEHYGGSWYNTDPITSLSLLGLGADLAAGSTVRLWGVS